MSDIFSRLLRSFRRKDYLRDEFRRAVDALPDGPEMRSYVIAPGSQPVFPPINWPADDSHLGRKMQKDADGRA